MFNKDFGKFANDLLTKDFPSNYKTEIATSTSTVGSVTATSVHNSNGFFVELNPVVSLNKKTTLDVNLNTEGGHTFKVIAKDALTKGLKSSVAVESECSAENSSCNSKVIITEDYTTNNATFSAKFVLPSIGLVAPKSTLGAVLIKEKFSFGIEGVFNADSESSTVEKGTVNVQYNAVDYVASVALSRAAGKAEGTLKYFYCNLPKYLFGAEIKANDGGVHGAVAFGTNLKNGAFAKAALRTNGSFALSYKKMVSQNTALTLGTEVDINSLVHKSGFFLQFEI